MATLADLLTPLTQSQYFTLIMDFMKANGVPVASWTSPRNTGLSLSQISAQFFAALRSSIIDTTRGMFLDYAAGAPLTLFAASQFQLVRTPAQFTEGILTLTSVASAPPYNFAASDLTVGTPGPSNLRLYSNTEPGSLQVGQLSIPGGAQGLTLERRSTGVTVRIVVAGLSTSLTVPALGVGVKDIVINVATDSVGNPTSTAAQIRTAILAQGTVAALVTPTIEGAGSFIIGAVPVTSLDVGTLLLKFSATTSGAAWNIASGSPLVLKTSYAGVAVAAVDWINSTWITSQGSDEESDQRLKQRCAARWGTLGVAGNVDGGVFWALAIPNGYSASPVSQAVIFAGYLSGTYAQGATVVIIGPNGALGSGDVAAVQANFESPIDSLVNSAIPGLELLGKKYPIGQLVSVVSAANNPITVTGTVYIRRSANADTGDVQAAVVSAIAAYQATLTMGQTIYPQQKLEGVISQADGFAYAIERVDLSGMAASIPSTMTQYPLLSLSGLAYTVVNS